LALFANNTASGTCDLFMQIVESTDSDPSTVFLGSMFLQGFVATWKYDYNSVEGTDYNQNKVTLLL